MRREEVDRLVAPVVGLAGVELIDRHEFHGGHSEILQVRDFVDYSGKGTGLAGGHAGVRIGGKAANMHLVDDEVARMPWRNVICPVESDLIFWQHAERRLTGIAVSPEHCCPAVSGWEKHPGRKGVEQQ